MKKIIILVAVLLASCKSSKIDYSYPEDPNLARKERAGKFFDDITFFGKKADKKENKSEKITVENSLWLASSEVIAQLLPISAIDASSGLIVTEWYQDSSNQNRRIKINLLVKGKEIVKENLVLSIFKQQKDKKGNWVDEKSDEQNLSSQLIKDKILDRAKMISSNNKS